PPERDLRGAGHRGRGVRDPLSHGAARVHARRLPHGGYRSLALPPVRERPSRGADARAGPPAESGAGGVLPVRGRDVCARRLGPAALERARRADGHRLLSQSVARRRRRARSRASLGAYGPLGGSASALRRRAMRLLAAMGLVVALPLAAWAVDDAEPISPDRAGAAV